MTNAVAAEKRYKTLSDIMQANARESMPIIARVAPAIEGIARKSGILKLVFSNTVAIASSPSQMAKLNDKARAKINAEMMEIGEKIILTILKSLGDCMDEYQEVLAAVNGITVDELLDNYTTAEILGMIREMVNDPDFLACLRTLTS